MVYFEGMETWAVKIPMQRLSVTGHGEFQETGTAEVEFGFGFLFLYVFFLYPLGSRTRSPQSSAGLFGDVRPGSKSVLSRP